MAGRRKTHEETVKTHLNNIYRKLNVTNRRHAVERAKSLAILRRGDLVEYWSDGEKTKVSDVRFQEIQKVI